MDQSSPGKQAVTTPKLALPRPRLPLPPVPPRHRPKSLEPIRIPINIVRRAKLENNNSNYDEVSYNPDGSPNVPHQNGNCCNNESDMINHDAPCSCQSGAHPKQQQPKSRPENGGLKEPSTPGKKSLFSIFHYECQFLLIKFQLNFPI